jgi:hypothetical protein
MNRRERKGFAGASRVMTAKIVREISWEARWHGFIGSMMAIREFAGQQLGLDPTEVVPELTGTLAKRAVEALKAPPIAEAHQALIYFLSPADRIASEMWQLQHPDEMCALQRQYSDWPDLFAPGGREHDERLGVLAVCAQAGVDPGEIKDHPEHGLCVSENGLRKLAAIAPNPGPARYVLEQIVQQRRRELRVVDDESESVRDE